MKDGSTAATRIQPVVVVDFLQFRTFQCAVITSVGDTPKFSWLGPTTLRISALLIGKFIPRFPVIGPAFVVSLVQNLVWVQILNRLFKVFPQISVYIIKGNSFLFIDSFLCIPH